MGTTYLYTNWTEEEDDNVVFHFDSSGGGDEEWQTLVDSFERKAEQAATLTETKVKRLDGNTSLGRGARLEMTYFAARVALGIYFNDEQIASCFNRGGLAYVDNVFTFAQFKTSVEWYARRLKKPVAVSETKKVASKRGGK